MTFTDEELNEFRKEIGKKFMLPENHIIFGQIANMPLWQRMIFKWQYKKQVEKKLRRDFCPVCGHILTVSEHYCDKCNERIACSLNFSEKSIKELLEQEVGKNGKLVRSNP